MIPTCNGFEAGWLKNKMLLSPMKSRHHRCSVGKGILRNFVKLTGNRLSQSLLFNKVAGWVLKLF